MSGGTWHLAWTLLLMVTFVGIVYWAWSSRRHKNFEEAAKLPLEEDQRGLNSTPENGESR
jgi:cytochrome c oxidase cbb3-type subunit IV